MKLANFKAFEGQHCETTTTGTLLKHIGLEFSEPMLFGLGEGLHFIFWNMKSMDFPFIGGRNKPDILTQNICKHLNLELTVQETASVKKAWQNVVIQLDKNIPVGLKLDCYHLDYFKNKIHFAGHYVAIYGYDNEFGYLVDTVQQGKEVKAKLENIALARNEKGPMSSRNLSYTIQNKSDSINIKDALKKAIVNNAKEYLNPPIKNLSYKGVIKTASEVKIWFKNSKNIEEEFKTTAMLMEKAGTGGALFRNLYRDFLKESYEILPIKQIKESHQLFIEIATDWSEAIQLFQRIGETKNNKFVNQLSLLLLEIANKEKIAMSLLFYI